METVIFLLWVIAILTSSTLVLVGLSQLFMKSRRTVIKAGSAAASVAVLIPTVTFIDPGYPAFGSLGFLIPLAFGIAIVCLPMAYVFARLLERLVSHQA